MRLRSARLAALLMCIVVCALVAQTNLGRIVGTVRDSSGAIIATAHVAVTNEGTGWTREFLSSDAGDYELPNLPAGTYSISAQLPGFKKFVRDGVVLDPGRTLRLDVRLEVGQVTEEVRVEASTPVVETETPAINNQINYDIQVKSAISTGNRPWELLTTVPTFQSGPSSFVYSIGGGRGAQTEFLIDGISSPGGGSPLGSTSMTTGAAKELQVHAVSNGAEYSQPGIYEQVSRSGTNEVHGEVRYFHSNSALNARSFFSPVKPKSRNHQFGIWLGGPLVLPKIYNGKDKTFWMFAYDGGRTPGSADANTTVPTEAMRAGNFSAFAAIRDPLTGQPFAGNLIPANRISANSNAIQQRFYPLPNFGNPAAFTALNHRILFNNSGKFDHGDFRMDQRITEGNTLYGRIGYQRFPVRALAGCGVRRAKPAWSSEWKSHTGKV